MSAVTRLGDITTGHDGFPPRPSVSASSTVFVNGLGVVRMGDSYAGHPHPGSLSSGSSTVFIEGKACGRIGDSVSCGDTVAVGSGNVFCG